MQKSNLKITESSDTEGRVLDRAGTQKVQDNLIKNSEQGGVYTGTGHR